MEKKCDYMAVPWRSENNWTSEDQGRTFLFVYPLYIAKGWEMACSLSIERTADRTSGTSERESRLLRYGEPYGPSRHQ